jgi:hypothetical protein
VIYILSSNTGAFKPFSDDDLNPKMVTSAIVTKLTLNSAIVMLLGQLGVPLGLFMNMFVDERMVTYKWRLVLCIILSIDI